MAREIGPNVMVLEAQAKAGLTIYRSLYRHGRRVIAAAPQRLCTGFFSQHVSGRVIYPPCTTAPDACAEFLIRYLSSGHIEMLYPVDQFMTALVARHQDEIRRHTRLILPPYEIFQIGNDKILTLKAARRIGVPIPRTWFTDEQPLELIAQEATYPCLIKPAVSVAAVGITLVKTPEELLEKFPAVSARFGNRCFVQEFVPHEGGRQHKVDVLMGSRGKVLVGFAFDKLRFYPPTGGSSTLNRVVHRPDMVQQAVRLLKEIGWYGFCDFDFITDPRDGVPKLMEINPRFPDTLEATWIAGLDVTEMMYQMAHGQEPAPQMDYRAGDYLRFLPGDIMWFITCRERNKHLKSWMRFFGRDIHYLVTSLREPGPAVGYLLENLTVLLDRQQRQARFRLAQARRRS